MIFGAIKITFLSFYHGIINIPFENGTSKFFGLLNYLNIFYFFKKKIPSSERLNAFLESMGPLFIKFGQLLSTRTDVLPQTYTLELQKLTDSCKPFEGEKALEIFKRSITNEQFKKIKNFDLKPLASASLAQVHTANLVENNQEIVIKILRPNISKKVNSNIKLLKLFAFFVKVLFKDSYRLKINQVVNDYERTILKEIDLRLEANNTIQTRENFLDSNLLYIPKVYKEFTSKNILVMERIYGTPCTDIDKIKTAGVDLKILAENGVKIFLDQVFRDNFFHADMHPGNIFVDLKNPEMNRYIAVDCAIVGSLSDADLYNLARMLSCTIKQDYKKLANLFISNQWVEQDSDVYDLEMTLKSCCEPIFEKPLAEIEFGKLLLFLFESTRSFGLSIQPSLVLLQKTLIHIEGMGRSIYPKLDFWSIAEPYLDDWIRNKYHPKQLLKYIEENKYEILEKGANLPNDILNILDALKSIADNPQHQNKKVEALKHEISKQQFINRLSLAGFLLLAVLFLINS